MGESKSKPSDQDGVARSRLSMQNPTFVHKEHQRLKPISQPGHQVRQWVKDRAEMVKSRAVAAAAAVADGYR